MALLTTSEIREHVETDLVESALQRIIDAEDAEIVRAAGAHTGNLTEVFFVGHWPRLYLGRPAGTIVTITETEGDTDTVLAVNDYRLLLGGRVLKRETGGDNPRSDWAEAVVVYTSVDTERRKRVLIDLVKLASEYSGLASYRDGDHAETQNDYQRERTRLLGNLVSQVAFA